VLAAARRIREDAAASAAHGNTALAGADEQHHQRNGNT
jgi:hypothetical protein